VSAIPTPPEPPERFVECSEGEPARPADSRARLLRAPRVDDAGFGRWARAVRMVADLLARPGMRQAHLVAALPIAADDTPAARDLSGYLARTWLASRRDLDGDSLASSFVQLAWPWARTAGSDALPERLESPDGVLAGLLARTALTRGAFRSAAGQHLADVYDVAPDLPAAALRTRDARGLERHLDERVCLLGPTPRGLTLRSDVTTDSLEAYRPAAVSRLVSLVVRTARRAGEESVFEPSGERVWAALQRRLSALLGALWAAGALRGASAAEAFDVRCDRSTTTQSDLDAGRVIVEVRLSPATPVETIRVVLALEEGGRVSARAA
jgi:phage tail sheath protein FI